jgi:ribosomal protein L7/L12
MSTVDQQDIALLRRDIHRLQAQMDQLYLHLGLTFVENTSANDDPQVVAALRSGNVIEAIKLYREKTDLGLAAAKADVDEMRSRLGL